MKKQEKINYIARKLKCELRWKAIKRKDICDALVSMYYLSGGHTWKNRKEVAKLILAWESEYDVYNTTEQIDEMLDTLYHDVVEWNS